MQPLHRVLIGTTKGAFVWDTTGPGDAGLLTGPHCDGAGINHIIGQGDTLWATGGDTWFGKGVWRSTDGGASWTRFDTGLALPDAEIEGFWSLGRAGRTLYLGIKPANLFKSDDDGASWTLVEGLANHPSRPDWMPGGAGLTLHTIVSDPDAPGRLWVGISTAGVFHTADGGTSWEPRNTGTRNDYAPPENRYPEVGQCVHNLVRATGRGDVLYQQNHCGMYRSDDGGRNWSSIEEGLPSSFGFPVAVHPKDAKTAWYVPLNGDVKGRFPPDASPAVWRTRDSGASWQALRDGLPPRAHFTVLRQALCTAPDAVLFFGTNTGSLFASFDEGDSWTEPLRHLPTILSVEVQHT